MCENCRSYGSDRFKQPTPKPTPKPTQYGWCWIDGETEDEIGNRWIEIGPLTDDGFLDGDEMAVIMLRNADESERKFPGITAQREATATHIVNALNAYSRSGAEGYLHQ